MSSTYAQPVSQEPGTTSEQPMPPGTADAPFQSYWGTQEVFRFLLPDGRQYFEFKALDEGGKSLFQQRTNRGVRVNQRTQDAHLDVDPASDRHQLIKASVVGFNIMQPDGQGGWSPLPTNNDTAIKRGLEMILERFDPKIIQDLELEIRLKNKWMQEDMDDEEIKKEIVRLEEMLKQNREAKEGEGGSANR